MRMQKFLILHQSRLSSSVFYGSNTSHYIRADYHGPVHRRNGLQIPRFLERFAGELAFISLCFVFCFFPMAKTYVTATELVTVRENKK